MRSDNIIDSISSAIYSAIYKDLPDINYVRRITMGKEIDSIRRPRKSDLKVYHFEQMWGSTALGFTGMGGASMTSAYTTVIILMQEQMACVYFDGQLAYKCEDDEKFRKYLSKHNMPGQIETFDNLKILK